ncbi:phospholipase D family protein [Shimia sp. SDUM112013]|uniref:phospholipase D family protein n=1 Tax=Shimia sp. SDUM112013 TaxID=3136160 RepID=UPI0032EDC2EC
MRKLLSLLLILSVLSVLAIMTARILFPLPGTNFETEMQSLPADWNTPLGQILKPAVERNRGQTGVMPLIHGRDAFTARALLMHEAQSSIDAQYYIWQNDTTGLMLLDELRAAAERGVRVRLLLDDNGIPGLDNMLAELDAMPHADVRIFNPFTLRNPKLASYLFDFPRLNRRMHNKSITFDGFATIIGGRNIGDIYFEFGQGFHYVDVDVLAVGDIVDDVTANFDSYWNSASVYDAEQVLPPHYKTGTPIKEAAATARQTALGSGYQDAIRTSALAQGIRERDVPMEWTQVELFSDPPTKGLGQADDSEQIASALTRFALEAETSVDMVSAYFVPGDPAMAVFDQMAANGVATRVLTNSMEATDVPPVHGAYMQRRPALLENGTQLFELRALREQHRELSLPEILAGSASSLHAKVMSFDRERAFIGSYNLDPRSANLNCEMGLLIESPRIATTISEAFDNPKLSYQVHQDETGALYWTESTPEGGRAVLTQEPNVGTLHRWLVTASGWLPIDWML